MLLKLIRTYGSAQTDGQLLIDGNSFCTTIEPAMKGNPWCSKGCIPEGWYKITVTHSPRFKRLMPILHMVPGFKGIRIHAGMRVENSRGCICVGLRETEEQLTQLLTQTQDRHEEIFIHITNTTRERERMLDELCLAENAER